ncbi:heat shock protein DnaJ domain-containing protein [Burkholderia pseudomallei]|uniref:J domain-containing protein n=1 Tax=Burkholderia pseudomallei TaxID=28450 RepID=UPI000F1EAE67|nr:J domain-containing protein [Burkholderia pseudomallei]CAJ7237571.1 heat shock protein DnaJ domain-containing protein [Burkholderia pseudomallei]VBC15461.1 heat shock protein DnaJ domain-containing protein [Burkholderia pseudomallei]VBS98764.1 heat shock protein DnaJ domain-containing protein [Burkholderia pseudomallei]
MAARFWVVVICLVLGYWLVSRLIEKGKAAERDSSTDTSGRTPEGEEAEEAAKSARASGNASSAQRDATWYEVLEVREDASANEIKVAYRRLMAQYHPDKVASLGRELRDLAEAKSKAVTQAYRRAMQLRGEPM